jgi:hypothetical protein
LADSLDFFSPETYNFNRQRIKDQTDIGKPVFSTEAVSFDKFTLGRGSDETVGAGDDCSFWLFSIRSDGLGAVDAGEAAHLDLGFFFLSDNCP